MMTIPESTNFCQLQDFIYSVFACAYVHVCKTERKRREGGKGRERIVPRKANRDYGVSGNGIIDACKVSKCAGY